MTHKQVAYVLLRITMGAVFLFYGVDKFIMGRAAVAGGIMQEFDKTFLPHALVALFVNVLPFLEVILGACVLLGLLTTITLGLLTALMAVLTVGQVITLNAGIVANNLTYSIILFLLLFFVEHNAFCLDQLWTKQDRRAAT